jgi:enterochelin esterase-like enzyme
MLEPQSTFLFILLILIFAGLMWWMTRTRRAVLRVVAAFVAFVVAVQFGVMAVNRYFDYYQTWGAAFADLSNAPPAKSQSTISATTFTKGSLRESVAGRIVYSALAEENGDGIETAITGPLSHITRTVLIYLPPQYFQPAYKNYRFPVIELIHGQPGEPQDWVNVVGVQTMLRNLVNSGLAKPAVLVMPDANGGIRISEQCLNQVGGPEDMTYLGIDLPNAIYHDIPRVQPPGKAWGIAGYSEGGFCAANMALQPKLSPRYGAAASLSGYYVPAQNQGANGKYVNPFGHNEQLRLQNTPNYEILHLPAGAPIPQFWLGAGTGDAQDVAAGRYFQQELQIYQAGVPLHLALGGHSMEVWRAQVPPMLEWMTSLLEQNAVKLDRITQLAAERARECAGQSTSRQKTDPAGGTSPTSFTTPGTKATIPAFCHQKPALKKPRITVKRRTGPKT